MPAIDNKLSGIRSELSYAAERGDIARSIEIMTMGDVSHDGEMIFPPHYPSAAQAMIHICRGSNKVLKRLHSKASRRYGRLLCSQEQADWDADQQIDLDWEVHIDDLRAEELWEMEQDMRWEDMREARIWGRKQHEIDACYHEDETGEVVAFVWDGMHEYDEWAA